MLSVSVSAKRTFASKNLHIRLLLYAKVSHIVCLLIAYVLKSIEKDKKKWLYYFLLFAVMKYVFGCIFFLLIKNYLEEIDGKLECITCLPSNVTITVWESITLKSTNDFELTRLLNLFSFVTISVLRKFWTFICKRPGMQFPKKNKQKDNSIILSVFYLVVIEECCYSEVDLYLH